MVVKVINFNIKLIYVEKYKQIVFLVVDLVVLMVGIVDFILLKALWIIRSYESVYIFCITNIWVK